MGIRENPEAPVYVCDYPNCHLHFVEPHWKTEEELREYYRSQYREHHEARFGTRLTAEERFKYQTEFMKDSVKRFKEDIPQGGSLLEVGCSAGGFLSHLHREGQFELYGAEWNPEDAEWNRKCGIPCEEGTLDEIYPGKTFTVIVAIHVMEHQPDPAAFIRKLRKKLIGGGKLYLEVPHANDPLSAIYLLKEYQDFFYRDVHVQYWFPHPLALFLDSLGFEPKVQPMQRYGLLNHMNWVINRKPMEDGMDARKLLHPVRDDHPMGYSFNRQLEKMDKEYRLFLQGQWATDALSVVATRYEI